ncbi:unnamed protein product [Amoebophrya sp. A120]|nr:unnamed protein product [Amoebophrya sp. A120]|eukprot:GSA120T00024968001.1
MLSAKSRRIMIGKNGFFSLFFVFLLSTSTLTQVLAWRLRSSSVESTAAATATASSRQAVDNESGLPAAGEKSQSSAERFAQTGLLAIRPATPAGLEHQRKTTVHRKANGIVRTESPRRNEEDDQEHVDTGKGSKRTLATLPQVGQLVLLDKKETAAKNSIGRSTSLPMLSTFCTETSDAARSVKPPPLRPRVLPRNPFHPAFSKK